MSSSSLEQIRVLHESAEAYEHAICAELDQKPNGQKAKTWQQHKIAKLLEGCTSSYQELKSRYADKDELLKDELQSMRGASMFNTFYETLNATREYHQRFPLQVPEALNVAPEVDVIFSGEEVYGKYLDLHVFFGRFCNLPNIPSKDQDYLQYLDKFNSFFYIPEANKSKVYVQYVSDLWEYLEDFLFRVQPLVELDEMLKEWKSQFNQKWAAGQIVGWKKTTTYSSGQAQPLRLGAFNDPSELEKLGMERLKEGLTALGLKCGGSLQDRAQRLWQVRGKKPENFPVKLLAKRKNPSDEVVPAAGYEPEGDARSQVAWIEFKISFICDVMMDIVTATRRHAEKQQARTVEEKEAEIAEEEMGLLPDVVEEEEHDDYDDGPLYNPLNLPLGWDGKPIPYWLYKLHGLGVEYKCEICGNQSYWGRRAFDRHFQEWRHAHGMRCLGVPNTKHFHDITLIEDVLSLYAKIKDSLLTEQFVGDVHEEFEDTEGNVLNRRIYEDLARQGLL